MYYDNTMMRAWGGDAWAWLFMFFIMLIFIFVTALVIRYLAREWHGQNAADRPLDILKKRYASGEIDKKEFDEKKKDLSK